MTEDSVGDRGEAVVFATTLVDQINRDDVRNMVHVQREMLSRFEKTNEMLINFNLLSSGRYEATLQDFQIHTQLLYDMKRDLDSVFKRIRVLKQRLSKTYPDAFAACSSVIMAEEDDDDDEVSGLTSQSGLSTSKSTPSIRASTQVAVKSASSKSLSDYDGMPGKSSSSQAPKNIKQKKEGKQIERPVSEKTTPMSVSAERKPRKVQQKSDARSSPTRRSSPRTISGSNSYSKP